MKIEISINMYSFNNERSRQGQKYSDKIIIRSCCVGYWYEKYSSEKKISEMTDQEIERAKNILIKYYQGIYHPKYKELQYELHMRYDKLLCIIDNKYMINIIKSYIF